MPAPKMGTTSVLLQQWHFFYLNISKICAILSYRYVGSFIVMICFEPCFMIYQCESRAENEKNVRKALFSNVFCMGWIYVCKKKIWGEVRLIHFSVQGQYCGWHKNRSDDLIIHLIEWLIQLDKNDQKQGYRKTSDESCCYLCKVMAAEPEAGTSEKSGQQNDDQ